MDYRASGHPARVAPWCRLAGHGANSDAVNPCCQSIGRAARPRSHPATHVSGGPSPWHSSWTKPRMFGVCGALLCSVGKPRSSFGCLLEFPARSRDNCRQQMKSPQPANQTEYRCCLVGWTSDRRFVVCCVTHHPRVRLTACIADSRMLIAPWELQAVQQTPNIMLQ